MDLYQAICSACSYYTNMAVSTSTWMSFYKDLLSLYWYLKLSLQLGKNITSDSYGAFQANEFGYSWSGYNDLNTAVFGVKARGKLIESLFDYIITENQTNFHPQILMQAVQNRNLPLIIYPSHFFDPVWAISDRFSPLDNNPYSTYVSNIWNNAKFRYKIFQEFYFVKIMTFHRQLYDPPQ